MTDGLKSSVLGPCNMCFLKTIIYLEVQKYLFGTNGLSLTASGDGHNHIGSSNLWHTCAASQAFIKSPLKKRPRFLWVNLLLRRIPRIIEPLKLAWPAQVHLCERNAICHALTQNVTVTLACWLLEHFLGAVWQLKRASLRSLIKIFPWHLVSCVH